MKDYLGERIKLYEGQFNQNVLKQTPTIVRLDGRSFHTFTKGMNRPYDIQMSRLMIETMKSLVKEFCPLIGYTQSDEISLLFFPKNENGELPFSGKVNKINSIFASYASVIFNKLMPQYFPLLKKIGLFDSRTFSVPTKTEAANYFLWRERDATKNSISMAAQSFYSHKELQGKHSNELQEMIFQKGQNWNDYPIFFKRGTWAKRKFIEKVICGYDCIRTEIETIHLDEPFATINIEEKIKFIFGD